MQNVLKNHYKIKQKQFEEGKINDIELKKAYQDYLNANEKALLSRIQYENNYNELLIHLNLELNSKMNFNTKFTNIKKLSQNFNFKNDCKKLSQKNLNILFYKKKYKQSQMLYKIYSQNLSKENVSNNQRILKKLERNMQKYDYLLKLKKINNQFQMSFLKIKNAQLKLNFHEIALDIAKKKYNDLKKKYNEGRASKYLFDMTKIEYKQKYYAYYLGIIEYNLATFNYMYFINLF